MLNELTRKLQARRSVLKRTTKRSDLPNVILYMEWLGGESSRKVLDSAGKEHVLTDLVVQSNYKLASGPESQKLIAAHWASQVGESQSPAGQT